MKTPFYELAEKIVEKQNTVYFLDLPLVEWDFYKEYLIANAKELKWYLKYTKEFGYNTDDVIMSYSIALLFADLLWQDEMKGK